MDDQFLDQSVDGRVTKLQADLSKLVHALLGGLAEQLAPYGIDALEYTALGTCFAAGTITLKDLRGRVPIDYGHLSRIVSGLEDKGLLEKRRPRSDRRLVRVEVTEKGKSLLPELMSRTSEYYTLVLRGIGEDDLSGNMAVMEKMIAGARTGPE